jgi:hypothetical protein
MKVEIVSGKWKGFTGHLSYDEDGTEWIVISWCGCTYDIQAPYVQL